MNRAGLTPPPLGRSGRIISGDDAGWFVEVIDDTDSSGGFLILTHERLDQSGQGYDSWAESLDAVTSYFAESGWQIEWLDRP